LFSGAEVLSAVRKMANWLRPSKNTNQKPEPLHTYEAKARRCLMCHKRFTSSWPGERVCPRCKTKEAWRECSTLRDQYE